MIESRVARGAAVLTAFMAVSGCPVAKTAQHWESTSDSGSVLPATEMSVMERRVWNLPRSALSRTATRDRWPTRLLSRSGHALYPQLMVQRYGRRGRTTRMGLSSRRPSGRGGRTVPVLRDRVWDTVRQWRERRVSTICADCVNRRVGTPLSVRSDQWDAQLTQGTVTRWSQPTVDRCSRRERPRCYLHGSDSRRRGRTP